MIFDEVATGFGRTGKMFAVDHIGIQPDFMVLSKGITGGYLPLSVVLLTDEVYSAFYCDYNLKKSFLHSHSYTGNPLACAAANAVLDIFENQNILEQIEQKAEYIAKHLEKFKSLSNVKETRQTGMIAAIELSDIYAPEERVNTRIYKYALKNGVLLRPLGNVVYVMPPLIISETEIDSIFDVAYKAIEMLK
jgi:adenosylmethionine-8-amino-7-oxononanoate aminotransferase